ncbi:MAG TPA: prolipoprotein diacylglyceryl transferase [Bradyrhizobium sp.]|nr:prolipoprotein diacylglyceryl transferase [Bradyrhizobium sp.]
MAFDTFAFPARLPTYNSTFMYPVLFDIRGFEVTSFGAMLAVAALVGIWIFRRELRRSGMPESAVDAALAGVLGGVVGAKLLWVVEHLGSDDWTALLFSRGGLSWFGGFVGGVLAGMIVMRRQRLSILGTIAAATPALAIGHAIGRIGCLLVGDDYGTPSDLPWAVAFPEGLPPTDVRVHPTMVYEAIALLPIAAVLLWMRRRQVVDRSVVGAYLVMTALVRFLIQWIRVYEPFAGPFGFAHIAALLVMAFGLYLLLTPPPPAAQPRGRR